MQINETTNCRRDISVLSPFGTKTCDAFKKKMFSFVTNILFLFISYNFYGQRKYDLPKKERLLVSFEINIEHTTIYEGVYRVVY